MISRFDWSLTIQSFRSCLTRIVSSSSSLNIWKTKCNICTGKSTSSKGAGRKDGILQSLSFSRPRVSLIRSNIFNSFLFISYWYNDKTKSIWQNLFSFRSHQDPNKWPVKDITPEDGMFHVNDNDQTEFILSELLPEKQYFFKTTVNVRDDNIESGYQVNRKT